MTEKPKNRYWFAKGLVLIFFILKATHYIDWSWLWLIVPMILIATDMDK